MYDLQYVRKRRRRRIAALVCMFSSIGVASLVVISFLGRTVGSFTVAIKNTSVRLALSEDEEFTHPTSYLRIDDIPSNYYEFSYKWFDQIGLEHVDDAKNDRYFGMSSDGTGMYYLKYTFFVKNIGNTNAKYDMYINLDESTKADNGKTLDESLRIMVFENDPSVADSHEKDVYAQDLHDYRYTVIDKSGKQTYQAFISDTPQPTSEGKVYEDDDHPLAESFLTGKGKSIIHKSQIDFNKNEIMRYTIVYWLEGEASFPEYDEQGNAKDPKGARIKLSVNINAAEYTIK